MFFVFTTPLWLGIIILIIRALVQSARKKQIEEAIREAARHLKNCPMCAETVKIEALICRHCGHKFESKPVQLLPRPMNEWKPPIYGPEPKVEPRPIAEKPLTIDAWKDIDRYRI